MEHEDTFKVKTLHADPSRHKVDDPELERLINGIVSGVKELERENRVLETRNSELIFALEHANERLVRFEQSASTNRELTKIALSTADHVLGRVEEAIGSMQSAAQVERDSHAQAISRSLDLQKKAVSLLEGAQLQAASGYQEREQNTVDMVRRTRESISSMVECLSDFAPSQDLSPNASLAMARTLDPKGDAEYGFVGSFPTTEGAHSETSLSTIPAVGSRLSSHSATSIRMAGNSGASLEAGSKNELIYDLRQLSERISQLARVATPCVENRTRQQERYNLDVNTYTRPSERRLTLVEPYAGSAEPQALPQFVEVMASPLSSFASLSAFHRAIQRLPGVVSAKVKGYDKGRLSLLVEYSGLAPLAEKLDELSEFRLQHIFDGRNRVEIVVLNTDVVAEGRTTIGS